MSTYLKIFENLETEETRNFPGIYVNAAASFPAVRVDEELERNEIEAYEEDAEDAEALEALDNNDEIVVGEDVVFGYTPQELYGNFWTAAAQMSGHLTPPPQLNMQNDDMDDAFHPAPPPSSPRNG